MRMVVVTGLSGSGRSAALKAFEDMGFYCVDNLPLLLLPAFVDFATEQRRQPGQPSASTSGKRIFPDRFPALFRGTAVRRQCDRNAVP